MYPLIRQTWISSRLRAGISEKAASTGFAIGQWIYVYLYVNHVPARFTGIPVRIPELDTQQAFADLSHQYLLDFAPRLEWTGVGLFFVLSGYLITTILLVERGKQLLWDCLALCFGPNKLGTVSKEEVRYDEEGPVWLDRNMPDFKVTARFSVYSRSGVFT